MAKTKLFPQYLDQGSKGGAVNMLGLLMKATGHEVRSREIEFDGDYTPGGAIAAAVMEFQAMSGFKGADIDGNFGPATRAKFKERCGIDVDTLTLELFTRPTKAVGPGTGQPEQPGGSGYRTPVYRGN